MAEESKLQNFVVGIVFLGGLTLLGFMTMLLKGVPLSDAKQIAVRFPTVNNLRTGEDVLIHGLLVGEVKDIEYSPIPNEDNNVLVRCTIDDRVPLTDKTGFRVRSAGPLGGRYIEIVPAPGEPRDSKWDGFRGRSDGDVFDQLGDLVRDTRESQGLFPRLLRDEDLARKFESALTSVAEIFSRIDSQMQDGQGLLPRLLADAELASKAEQTVDEIRGTFRSLNEESGIIASVRRIFADVEAITGDIRSQKGILGVLVSDEASRQDLQQTLSELRTAVENLSAGKGVLGKLMSDEELSTKVDQVVTDLRDIMDTVNSRQGTLGEFINNRAAWDELMRLLVLARESIEDFREQAPINTFAQVLFAVF